MDINDIDNALHEIKQMALAAIGAAENLKAEPVRMSLAEAQSIAAGIALKRNAGPRSQHAAHGTVVSINLKVAKTLG